MTREERIRALAGQMMTSADTIALQLGPELFKIATERALREAALIIDAIDALPVPGESDCECCDGTGEVRVSDVDYDECRACNGTGKASE